MSIRDADAEIKRIRRDLAAYPADLVDWEAACLKHVADLLDSLEQARGEWGSLSHRLNETKTRLSATEAEREGAVTARDEVKTQLERARTDLVELRASMDTFRAERTEEGVRVKKLEGELKAARAELASERKTATSRQAELEKLRDALTAVERERDELVADARRAADLQKELERTRTELEVAAAQGEGAQGDAADMGRRLTLAQNTLVDARQRLARVEQERDRLAEAGEEWGAVRAALGEANVLIDELKQECASLRAEGEQKFMQICELRVRENRMETERDDAKRKRRKILAKVHSVLDETGAPACEDTSFGERIRWLKGRIDELEAGGA
ncbi:MAG: hypothetical protein OER88_08285 [Planctomycetota bacterium]|nr:hypothetical protein [Planctomycetota bacterium]